MHALETAIPDLPLFPVSRDPCANRHGGNHQSVEAFKRVDVKGDCARIMAYYAGGKTWTPKEIARLMDVSFNRISGRFVTLKRGGLLRATGVVRSGSGELEAVK